MDALPRLRFLSLAEPRVHDTEWARMGMEPAKKHMVGFCTDHINGINTAQHTASLFDEHQPSSAFE
jgi:hypothetical protein